MYFRNELRHHVSYFLVICLCSVAVYSGAKNRKQMMCSFSGKSYSRGDNWYHLADNPKGPICLACHCHENGQVNCTTNKCGTELCSYEDNIDEKCCKKCTDMETEDAGTHEHMLGTFTFTNKRGNSRNDCLSGGQIYSQGATWHPVIGPLGRMDCVVCKCQLGKVVCSRLSCKETKTSLCAKVTHVLGHCCPICVSEETEIPKETPSFKEVQKQNPLVNKTSEKNCIPRQMDTLVFRSQGINQLSGYYQYAFRTVNNHRFIRLLFWMVKAEKMTDFSEQHLSKSEFGVLKTKFTFTLLGATKTKLMDRFIKKSKKLAGRCTSSCHGEIARMENVLRLKEISRKPRCSKREKPFEM
ncbi:chordin-like protein 1 isoform X2 [Limulus polyphemus]|uniref:Chordin-like protein 1 isoform X2 n=1 Tax=Limulus polyphemus TaxID=6850 RepID=A0ABM1SRP3_LIMPO|nr:chordin-like protein 1 isoform X2 [Limulus polyphemus]